MNWVQVTTLEALKAQGRARLELDGRTVLVLWHEGQVYAIEDRCTHDDGPLAEGEVEDGKIICPRHGARFDLATGRGTLPAPKPVRVYQTKVEDGQVFVGYEERTLR